MHYIVYFSKIDWFDHTRKVKVKKTELKGKEKVDLIVMTIECCSNLLHCSFISDKTKSHVCSSLTCNKYWYTRKIEVKKLSFFKWYSVVRVIALCNKLLVEKLTGVIQILSKSVILKYKVLEQILYFKI